MADNDRRPRIAHEAEHRLEGLFSTLEETLLFRRFQVHLVEERPRPFRSAASTDKVDRITIPEDRPDAALAGDGHRHTGVSVGVVNAQIEQDLARLARPGEIDQRSGPPAAIAIELGRQDVVPLRQPVEPAQTMLDFHHEARLGGERRVERHDPIAMSGLLARVTTVLRLDPDQTGVVQWLPTYFARPGRHALARNVIRDRQIGDRGDRLPGWAPNLGLPGEVNIRYAI